MTRVTELMPLLKRLQPRIDATPEEMAQAMFRLPADYQWQYD